MKPSVKIAAAIIIAAIVLLCGGIVVTIVTTWWGIAAAIIIAVGMVYCRKADEVNDFFKLLAESIIRNWAVAFGDRTTNDTNTTNNTTNNNVNAA
jgi:4-hydroxybenzoate polyprenyltransferase